MTRHTLYLLLRGAQVGGGYALSLADTAYQTITDRDWGQAAGSAFQGLAATLPRPSERVLPPPASSRREAAPPRNHFDHIPSPVSTPGLGVRLCHPLLQALAALGGEGYSQEVMEAMVPLVAPHVSRSEQAPGSDGRPRWCYHAEWAGRSLVIQGLMEAYPESYWRLTDAGWAEVGGRPTGDRA